MQPYAVIRIGSKYNMDRELCAFEILKCILYLGLPCIAMYLLWSTIGIKALAVSPIVRLELTV